MFVPNSPSISPVRFRVPTSRAQAPPIAHLTKENPLQRRFARRAAWAIALAALTPLFPASAHVRSGVLGGTVTPTVFRAPVEGGTSLAAHHTQAIIIDLPPGLSIAKCYDSAEFSCTTTDLQAIWTRKPGSTNFASADYFRVDIQTPPVATLTFDTPATQIYSDGQVVRWSANDQSAAHPAPQLSVKTPPDLAQPLVTTGPVNPIFGATTLPITGTATVTRGAPNEGDTTLEIDVNGLTPGVTYPVHLHEGTCNDNGPHYMTDPLGAAGPPNELWASSDPNDRTHGITADATGHAHGTGIISGFSPARPSARSVFLHLPGEAPGTGGGGGGGGGGHTGHLLAAAADPHAGHGVPIACADLGVPPATPVP
ncbi:MAG: large repetitive protein [Actinomycetota bacterium]|nr:large repetitive protein [Actinomycetota bacterium]